MAWRTRDLLLGGEFCPPRDVEDELESIKRDLRLPWLVLVTDDFESIMQTLCFAVATDPSLQARLIEALQALTTSFNTTKGKKRWTEALQHLAASDTFPDGPAKVIATTDEVVPGHLRVWLLSGSASIRTLDRERLLWLAEMVNGTAIANLQRDHKIMRIVRGAAPSALAATPKEPKSKIEVRIAPLLKIATAAVPCASVAYYSIDPASSELVLEAEHSVEQEAAGFVERISVPELPTSQHYLERPMSDYECAVRAFQTGHTWIFPDSHLRGQVSSEHIRAWPSASLAVPSSPFGRDIPNRGVLIARKRPRAADASPFSLSELAMLRNIALRLALAETLEHADKTSGTLSDFARFLSEMRSDSEKGPRSVAENIPWDIESSRAVFDRFAKFLTEATQSNSVCFRAVITVRKGGRSGQVLRRFAAYPEERLDDPHKDIDISASSWEHATANGIRSLNAAVAFSGRVGYVYNRRTNLAIQVPRLHGLTEIDGREPIVSEICLPMFSDGQLIGTVNLESSMRHNYTDRIEALGALSALCGLAVSLRRLEINRRISEQFAKMRVGEHAISKIDSNMAALAQRVSEEDKELVRALRRAVLQATPEEQPVSRSPRAGRRPVLDVIKTELMDYHFHDSVELKLSQRYAIEGNLESRFTAAIRELLENIFSHAVREPPFIYQVQGYIHRLGGKDMLWLIFRNRVNATKYEFRTDKLYRAPIERIGVPNRPHLGCFTIGELIRSIGGSAEAVVTDDRIFETHFLVPCSVLPSKETHS